jgi:periplasmic copper chaperone A
MNLRSFTLALALLLAGSAGGAFAHDYQAGSLKIAHPWARFTVPGQSAGGAFFSVQNTGAADRLVGASSPAAERVEMHTMAMEGNLMKMREVNAIALPAGQTVDLQPSTSFHLMMMGLKAPLKQGDKVPLTLRFEKAGEVKVELKVEAATPSPVRPPLESASGGAEHQHQH